MNPSPSHAFSIGELLTPGDAAKVIGCSSATLARWRVLRKGPPYYRPTGKKVMYALKEIELWFKSTREGNDADQKTQWPVALPALGPRPRVHREHRLGGHRTREEARRGDGRDHTAGNRHGAPSTSPG